MSLTGDGSQETEPRQEVTWFSLLFLVGGGTNEELIEKTKKMRGRRGESGADGRSLDVPVLCGDLPPCSDVSCGQDSLTCVCGVELGRTHQMDPVQDADAQSHEGFGEVDDLFSL